MQKGLQRAKSEWTHRLEDLQHKMTHSSINGSTHGTTAKSSPASTKITPFQTLLRLFAHDEQALQHLDVVFATDDGAALTFYVPQLLSFLLHGALYSSPVLEDWILDKCEQSPFFAHRCYWFLRAWCLHLPAQARTPSAPLSRRNSNNSMTGNSFGAASLYLANETSTGLAPFLDEPVSPDAGRSICKPRDLSLEQDKFLPEEREMIERLMNSVQHRGEIASLELQPQEHPIRRGKRDKEFDNSPLSMVQAAESGKIPVDPATGYPSVRHFDALVGASGILGNVGFPVSSTSKPHADTNNATEQFDRTPQFLDALIFLAEHLFTIPREERSETLRQQLKSLECELLPCNSIYVPIGNCRHRVWRIAAEESIPISTKERVPCIVALEVIDYVSAARTHDSSSAWNMLRGGNSKRGTAKENGSTDASSHCNDQNKSMENTTITTSDVAIPAALLSEAVIVAEWRYGQRAPLRRVSLLDKVATSVKAVGAGLKKEVKSQLDQLRERGSSEEMLSLAPLADFLGADSGLDANIDEKIASGADRRVQKKKMDVEHGEGGCCKGIDDDNHSVHSLVSLGQWSSPPTKALSQAEGKDDVNDLVMKRKDLRDLRRRLNRELPELNRRSSPLPYGSDTEEDPTDRSLPNKKPPLAVRRPSGDDRIPDVDLSLTKSTRTPPVVFRESWDTKEERVRQRSALGHVPGWRLLPILIKANDDLRQEQLASQLIQRMAYILAREKVPVWLCPYEILALTDRAGIIEAIPDTISLDSLKKNSSNYTNLLAFFHAHYGEGTEELAAAKANFVESLAAYSIVCFVLQIKDRHNGNILLDKFAHIIHIDFGAFDIYMRFKRSNVFHSCTVLYDMVLIIEGIFPDNINISFVYLS
jgi:Phosphatidylinositol 3- and 4-kinase